METQHGQCVICDTTEPGVRVARFVRPDLREKLYDGEAIADCSLYRELHAVALADLAAGETLILNFALAEWFPSRFYSLLLEVRKTIQARSARLLLCCFTPIVRECFTILKGDKYFEIVDTEEKAVKAAKP